MTQIHKALGFPSHKAVQLAYKTHIVLVRKVFEGFYSGGLIDRMCCELFQNGCFECETQMQYILLSQSLRGQDVNYDPAEDPELT